MVIDHDLDQQSMPDEGEQNDEGPEGLETPSKTPSELDEELLQPTPDSFCDSENPPSLPSTAPSSPAPGGSLSNTPNKNQLKHAKVGLQKNNVIIDFLCNRFFL